MAIKFLSDEWAEAVSSRLQVDEGVLKAAQGQTITVQQVVTGLPGGGDCHWIFRLTAGTPEVELGLAEDPEATVSVDYPTAVALDKAELDVQAAFLQGKLKVKGNLMRLLQLQGVIQSLESALAELEREY